MILLGAILAIIGLLVPGARILLVIGLVLIGLGIIFYAVGSGYY